MPPIHGALQPGATANFDNKKYLKKLKPESTDVSSNGVLSTNGSGAHNRYPSHHQANKSEQVYNKNNKQDPNNIFNPNAPGAIPNGQHSPVR